LLQGRRRQTCRRVAGQPERVYKTLSRHGLNTRAKRLALVACYRAPREPPREPVPEPQITTTKSSELVGIDRIHVGRLRGTASTG
jgi:hypothetical protein